MRAVIFDFDGTIADTMGAIREAVNETMLQYEYPTHDIDSVCSFISNGARNLVCCAMPAHLQKDEELIDRVFADYQLAYEKNYLHTECAYDGIPELIRELHDRGVAIGVLSNKKHEFVENLCHQVLFWGSFDAVQGVIDGQPPKPHPYLIERLAKKLGVAPCDCIMVGDSDVDILTAKNAGMTHVGVSWGYRDEDTLRKKGAALIAHTPNELKQILKKITEKGI